MVVPLEMGWRHLLFENWPVEPWTLSPAATTVETDTLLRADGFARPEAEPVY